MTDGKYAGLSSYLAGVSSLDLVTVPHSAIPNLVAIPTGPLPPNPADLLSSRKLAEALRQLRNQYKFIVIDSPPIMVMYAIPRTFETFPRALNSCAIPARNLPWSPDIAIRFSISTTTHWA